MGSSLPPSCLTTRQNSRGAMIMEGFSWRSGKYDVKYGVVREFFCEIVEIWLYCIDFLYQALFEDFWTSQAWNPPDPSVRVEIELWWRVYNPLGTRVPGPCVSIGPIESSHLGSSQLYHPPSQACCRVLNLRCTEAQMQRMVFINPSSSNLDLHSYDFALQCTSSDWSYL